MRETKESGKANSTESLNLITVGLHRKQPQGVTGGDKSRVMTLFCEKYRTQQTAGTSGMRDTIS
jgi:hypothetical protein